MKNLKKVALALFVLSMSMVANGQQKIAHLNSTEIMQKMDDYKVAELVLDSLTKALTAEITTYRMELQRKQESYGLLDKAKTSDAVRLMKEKEITDMEQRINQFGQDAQTDMQNKQTELLEPIQKKLQKAIEVVAKDKGYAYVMDDQALLVKPEADDISAAVKVKLGISTPLPTPAPAPAPAPAPKK
ncbi:MAG: OmpH family outer membrane protein [Bacteroidetes bacterium]|nr:OmpH family outer membrane protein [Bacteroidota bacterium]